LRGVWDAVTGLTIIVASADSERFRAALTLANAQGALGGRVRLFCHEASVALLAPETSDPPPPPSLPDRTQMIAMARELGVTLIACQTGLALAGVPAAALPGIETGGMVELLASLGDDRLVVI